MDEDYLDLNRLIEMDFLYFSLHLIMLCSKQKKSNDVRFVGNLFDVQFMSS